MADLATQNTGTGTVLPEAFKDAFRWMVLARTFEDKIASVYRAGKIVGGVYVGRGQEAFSAALAVQLNQGKDVYAPLIRDMAGRSAFGEPVIDAARTYLGSAKGSMRGRDGNIHRGSPREGVPAMISHLGAMISVVSGMLFARRLRGQLENSVGAACIGDGATSTGSVHEALNLASIEKLPLVIAVANNQFAYSTPNSRQFACKDLVDRAIGYGIEGINVDGTDLADCLQGFNKALSRAKSGKGPQLVVGKLLRLSGHGEHDDSHYIPEQIRSSDLGKDCLIMARERIIAEGWANEDFCTELEEKAAKEVENAILQASSEEPPDPYTHDWNACFSERFRDTLPDQ